MPSVASVEGKCLLISVLFVNISPVLTRIRTIAKNVEYAGRLTQKIFFFHGKCTSTIFTQRALRRC